MSVSISRVHHPDVVKLGRIYVPDDRDAAYSLRAITAPLPERTTPWQIGPVLDQGQTPECVAYTGREWLNAEPQNYPDPNNPSPQQLYDLAQANDGIAGPHEGSNDRGLMKGLQSLGLVGDFHWAANVDDAIQYLLTTGTLMCGSNWTQGMFTPDSNGFIWPLGPVEGGHEFHNYWYSRAEDAFWYQQTWGPNWDPAFPARFKMKRASIETLFAQGLDFCAATLKAQKPVNPPLPPVPAKPSRRRWHWI